MRKETPRKLNKTILAVLSGAMLLSLTACGEALEDSLVPPETPSYNAYVPNQADVIRGDLERKFEQRLDLLGYERIRHRFTQAQFSELYGTYQLEVEKIHVQVGDRVHPGDLMVSFHSRVLDEQITANEKKITDARLSIEHLRNLESIDSAQNHSDEIKRLEREISVAELYISDVNDTYRKLNIYSEVDGHVSAIDGSLQDGFVMPDTDLILVDVDEGIYKTEKPEYYTFKVGETYTATTRYSECQVEVIEMPEGGSATSVYFRPVGREGEILEKNLMLNFELPVLKDACYVNRQAVYEKNDRYFVYVVREDGMREARYITPGEQYGNYLIVKDGLEGGEKVELP